MKRIFFTRNGMCEASYHTTKQFERLRDAKEYVASLKYGDSYEITSQDFYPWEAGKNKRILSVGRVGMIKSTCWGWIKAD